MKKIHFWVKYLFKMFNLWALLVLYLHAQTHTYLMEELGQLYFHLLSLEHVIFSLLTDGWDQVKLPGH